MIHTPQSPWLNPAGTVAVFLVDNRSELEKRILEEWIVSTRAESDDPEQSYRAVFLNGWADKKHYEPVLQLGNLLQTPVRHFFIPLRVLWFPRTVKGERRARFSDIFMGDPRRPSRLRQRWIYRREPDRCHLVAADGSDTPDLVSRYSSARSDETLAESVTSPAQDDSRQQAEFILRQAILSLERAERRQRGARYKVPRLVADLVLERADFVSELRAIAAQESISLEDARKEAAACLKEMAADHRTFFLDLMVSFSRYMYRRGFDPKIQYLEEDVNRIRELAQRYPVAFLMTHKSYLDGCVMACLVYELDLPPLHLFGGINLDLFLAGTFARRSGTIFIRRSFQDDKIYKLVIRSYIQYLVEKRFPLNWAFEGTRSRTGKLMPPKYGLLRYVMDGALHVKDANLQLVPVSIAYDQLPDVSDYIKEQRGAEKKKESFVWLKQYITGLSKPYGKIHVRFGREINAMAFIEAGEGGKPNSDHVSDLEIQKLAFQVAVEANRVTPITATSLIIFVLMAEGYRALTLNEILFELKSLAGLINLKKLPKISDFVIDEESVVQKNLHALAENHVLICYEEGAEPVYAVAHGSKVAAAYYRNTMIHFLVNGAIAELAMLDAANQPARLAPEEMHADALRLRDLLKFEFFFSDKATFLQEIEDELSLRVKNWKAILLQEEKIDDASQAGYPLVTSGALRPFVEAYRVAAEVLLVADANELEDSKALVRKCVSLGQQMVLQQRIASDDSVNKVYFENAIKLAASRDLLEPDAAEQRLAFAQEIREVCQRIDYFTRRARSRRLRETVPGYEKPSN